MGVWRIMKKRKSGKKSKAFQKVADATRYSPVTFQTDMQEAMDNELVREAEEKLFLYNIEVADKFHQVSLDISADDLFGDKPESSEDKSGKEKEEEKEA